MINGNYFFLTISIKKKGLRNQLIKDTEVAENNFFKKHLKTLKQNYYSDYDLR